MKCTVNTVLILVNFLTINCVHLNEPPQHRTKAATEKQHDLWCYRCDSMNDGDKCLNLTGNFTQLHTKCTKDQKKCRVRRISVSTSTEEITGKPKLWLLHRDCSESCESSCIIIGERTKLHSCITCCDEMNFCNVGNFSNVIIHQFTTFLLIILYVPFAAFQLNYY